MKTLSLSGQVLVLLALFGCSGNQPQTTKPMPAQDSIAVKGVLLQYRDALNSSNVQQVLNLYTNNGVFMPSGAPTAIGIKEVQAAYEFVFSSIQLNIEFYIDEIEVAGSYAFARTTSRGTTLVHATNVTVPEENRELFVLKKEPTGWKIDRYMFNKMK